MKKVISIALFLTIMLSITACSGNEAKGGGTSSTTGRGSTTAVNEQKEESMNTDGVWDPLTPYKEPVIFNKPVISNSIKTLGLLEGDSITNNPYTRHVKERVNVEVAVAWEIDSNNYDQKLSLAIASQDIPDVLTVNRSTFRQLVDNDLIADLTPAYEKCMAPWLKDQLNEYGEVLFRDITVDGKLMGLPHTNISDDHPLLWIRKDWLDKLNLQIPKTLDEIIFAAKQFIEKDPGGNGPGKTVGLTLALSNEGTLYNVYGSSYTIETIFSTFDAYPGKWIEKDGKAVWGSIQPENKAALEKMAQLYKQGILDKEFAVRKAADREAMISSGRLGMGTAKQYMLEGTPDSVVNNPAAEWAVVSAPVDKAGKLKVPQGDPIGGITVVRKGYEHPEAIIKAINAGYEMLRGKGEIGLAAFNKRLETNKALNWSTMPVPINISPKYYIRDIHEDIKQALEKNDREAMKLIEFRDIYDLVKKDLDNPKKDPTAWQKRMQRLEAAEAAISDNQEDIPVAFFEKTKTMSTKWTALTKLESDTYLNIIMGEVPITEFDNFTSKWLEMGGQQITDEVNQMRAK